MKLQYTGLAACAFSSLLVVLCGAESDDPKPDTTTKVSAELEIFSWWTAPGEAEALDALLTAHKTKNPNIRFLNIAVVNKDLDPELELNKRMGLDEHGMKDAAAKPQPPELMQWDIYGIKDKWLSQDVKFAALEGVYEASGWKGKLYPFIAKDIEFDGHILALPVGLHRENGLFYNRQMLRDLNISEASLTSWKGFLSACETIKKAGKTCVALTQEDWVNSILFRSVAAMTMGAKGFHDYFGGAKKDEPLLETALQNFKLLFDEGYVGGYDNEKKTNVAAWGWDHLRESGWDEAAKDVHKGKAAFYFHGDWAVGLYKSLGWTEKDLGVIPAPGSEGLFVYGADGFLVPDGGDHRQPVMDVVRTWGEPATLAAFNKAKGSTPPRPDVDVSSDPLAAMVAKDLRQALHVMSVPAWFDGAVIMDLAQGKATAKDAAASIAEHYPTP